MSAPTGPTRRAVVLAGVGVAVTACHGRRRAPAAPAADQAALEAAVADETALLQAYDAVLAAHPTLRPDLDAERTDHAAHLAALRRRLAGPLPAAGTPPAVINSRRDLRARMVASAGALFTAAQTATDGMTAALLASISASHQVLGSHPVVSTSSGKSG